LKEILEERRDELATAVVQEMGKPIAQANGEITKSIQHLDYYMNHSDQFLAPEKLDISSGQKGVLIHQPLGPIVVIMPWNFPIWLTFKSVIPPMVLGNSIMIKPAESTPRCGELLEEVFREAGFGKGEYTNMFISHAQCE
jgi:succinate-semialdehyde dehydrogenase/glutarate-semialdehyde dehydrogenase